MFRCLSSWIANSLRNSPASMSDRFVVYAVVAGSDLIGFEVECPEIRSFFFRSFLSHLQFYDSNETRIARKILFASVLSVSCPLWFGWYTGWQDWRWDTFLHMRVLAQTTKKHNLCMCKMCFVDAFCVPLPLTIRKNISFL